MSTTDLKTTDPGQAVRRGAVASLPLATGAALVVHIVAGINLAAGVLLMVAIFGSVAVFTWRRTPPATRQELARRARIGAASGVAATAAYDVTRLVFVTMFHFTFWPFDIFTRFGRLLMPNGAPNMLVVAAGITFHCLNGIGFATAYAIAWRRPSIPSGLAWAFGLELAMLSLYPSWLGIERYGELFSVSILGHVAYGSVLGITARTLLKGDRFSWTT